MKTEVEKLEKNEVMLTVEVPADAFAAAVQQAYKKVAKSVNISGFRKGKIPRPILEQRVGKEYIIEEAVQDSLPNFYYLAVEQAEIEPIAQPEVDVQQAEEGQPFIFKAKVEVKPEVTLGEYKGLEIEAPSQEIKDEELDQNIERLRESIATLEVAPEGTTVENGHSVVIDFKGTVDDEPVEGGSADDYLLEVGSNQFVPGVEEQMVGMSKGETKDIWVDIPEDYFAKQIAGKRVKFVTTVKEIKTKKIPPADDNLAKGVGFDTLDEYKDSLRKKFAQVKEGNTITFVRNQAVRKATEAAEIDLPESMVERQLEGMLADFDQKLKAQGTTMVAYLEATGQTMEDVRAALRDEAEFQVKSNLVLEAIAKAESIQLSDEDIEGEIALAAESLNRTPEEVEKMLISTGRMNYVLGQLMVRKTIDLLVENASVTYQSGEAAESTAAGSAGENG